jgi:hypothetical protein
MPRKYNDITGQRFGRLVVLRRVDNDAWGGVRFLCQCDCGNQSTVLSSVLTRGKTKSCGCRKLIDTIGRRFGRLVAIRVVGKSARGNVLWECRCDCTNICVVSGCDLRSGHTCSCGCLVKWTLVCPPKHGHARHGRLHPLYNTWVAMRKRCNNPDHKSYKDYGRRGIQVCERWDNDPVVFIDDILSSIGLRPSGKVLDRINNEGNYEPGNVRWVTPKVSANNRRLPTTKGGRSGVQGVHSRRNRWEAKFMRNGITVNAGYFATVEAAQAAYHETVDHITADAACEEAFERLRWLRIESEIFFAQHAEFMMSAAA